LVHPSNSFFSTMRVIVTVASCIGIGFLLQGCEHGEDGCVMKDCGDGGDGGEYNDLNITVGNNTNKTSSCLAEKMDTVSQTLSGVTEVSVDEVTKTGVGMKLGGLTASFTEMFDFDNFNVREDVSGIVEEVRGTSLPMNTTQILNFREKHVIVYVSHQDLTGEHFKECRIHQLPPDTPSPEVLSQIFQTIVKPTLQSAAVCGGNNGMYDTWKFKETFSGKLPAIPNMPEGLTVKDGMFSEEVQMTKDALLHSSVTTVNGEILNGTKVFGNLTVKASMNVTDVKAVGPSAADLQPSQFDVECKSVNTAVDLAAFLQTKFAGVARWQLLRILTASKQSDNIVTV